MSKFQSFLSRVKESISSFFPMTERKQRSPVNDDILEEESTDKKEIRSLTTKKKSKKTSGNNYINETPFKPTSPDKKVKTRAQYFEEKMNKPILPKQNSLIKILNFIKDSQKNNLPLNDFTLQKEDITMKSNSSFADRSFLKKKNTFRNSEDISMKSFFLNPNKNTTHSVIMTNDSFYKIQNGIEKKRKLNEEKMSSIERTYSKKDPSKFEEKRKAIMEYYKTQSNKKKGQVFFMFESPTTNKNKLSFIHNERIMLKGNDKKNVPFSIGKGKDIYFEGTQKEIKKNVIFKFDGISKQDNKDELFLIGNNKKDEESQPKEEQFSFSNHNKIEFPSQPKGGLFDTKSNFSFAAENDSSINANNEPEKEAPQKKEPEKPKGNSLFGFSQPAQTGTLFNSKDSDNKGSLFGTGSTPSIFGFSKPDDKQESKPSTLNETGTKNLSEKPTINFPPKEDKPLISIPKPKETSENQKPFISLPIKQEDKPKEPEKPTISLTQKDSSKPGTTSLFGSFSKTEEQKPLFSSTNLSTAQQKMEEPKSTLQSMAPLFENQSEGSLLKKSNPFVAAGKSTNQTTSLFGNSQSTQPASAPSTSLFGGFGQSQENKNNSIPQFNQNQSLFGNNPVGGEIKSSIVSDSGMELSPTVSPRKIEIGQTSNVVNNNILFSQPTQNNLFSGASMNNTQPSSLFGSNTGAFGAPQSSGLFGDTFKNNNNLFGGNNSGKPSIFSGAQTWQFPQNSSNLGVPQMSTNPTFSMGIKTSGLTFAMGKK